MIIRIQKLIIAYAPDCIFIPLMNISNKIKGRNASITKHDADIYAVSDNKNTIHCARRIRLERYFFGLQKQCEKLSKEYLLNHVTFRKDDVLIDCGANNGEIGIWANQQQLDYHAFEPEPLEARCCDLNNYGGNDKTNRKALWHKQTTLNWYSNPETADSSAIEANNTDHITAIETTTLDHYVKNAGIKNIRLFKLEAEGAEPEVLQGAIKTLPKIDYIAVDCGYERGQDQSHTFIDVYNILKQHNFEIIASEFKRVIFLFKRIET